MYKVPSSLNMLVYFYIFAFLMKSACSILFICTFIVFFAHWDSCWKCSDISQCVVVDLRTLFYLLVKILMWESTHICTTSSIWIFIIQQNVKVISYSYRKWDWYYLLEEKSSVYSKFRLNQRAKQSLSYSKFPQSYFLNCNFYQWNKWKKSTI